VPPQNPLAIVLGGTQAHVELIRQLKSRGYRVLLVDYLDAPPAASVADEHSRVSTLAMDEVAALARQRNAALVIATCVDRANVTAAYVAERLALPAPYGHDTAALIANKLTMKQRLVSAGIPTAPFVALQRGAGVGALPFPFPVVVKPTDTGGSKGVRKASNVEELVRAMQEAFAATCAPEVLVERFLEGIEVGADCFVRDGASHVLVLRRKYVMSGRDGEVLATYASVCPAGVTTRAESRITAITRDIARAFGLRDTPLLVQLIVDGDDVRVIELAPRVGGGTNHRQVMLRTGVDLVGAAIDSYLGVASPPVVRDTPGCSASVHLYAKPGRYGEMLGDRALLDEGVVDTFYLHKARGAQIGTSMSSSNRVASFIVAADSREALLRRIRDAVQRLDAVDVDGRSILLRDVYLKTL
jgi:biotin carboxylase